ncbi:MAG: hypothetical protein ACLQVJ_14995 [Syntrophobacteraceae bacterium]
MFTEEIIAIAKQLGRLGDLHELEQDLANHKSRHIYKTSLSPELDGVTDPKVLFGYNCLRFIQLLLFRSRSLIEGNIDALSNYNMLCSLTCVMAHFETTGSMAYLLRRLDSYYSGNIDFDAVDNYLFRLSLGAKVIEMKEVPEPINVMSMIDSVDYHIKYLLQDAENEKMFRSLYDDLSEFCHPNFLGISGGSDINCSEKAIIYHEPGTMLGGHISFFFYLNMSTRLFLHFHKESTDLLRTRETMPIIHCEPPS